MIIKNKILCFMGFHKWRTIKMFNYYWQKECLQCKKKINDKGFFE
jgi:hypothetical protein